MAPDRRVERRAALLDLLAQRGFDGIVLSHLPNIRYLTGFTGTSALALVSRHGTVLLTDFRYRTQAGDEAGTTAQVEIVERDLWGRLGEVLGALSDVERVGFEAHAVSAADVDRVRSALGKRYAQGAGEVVEALRVRKDAWEVAAVRRAAEVAGEAFEATLGQVRAGLRELDVAAVLEGELRRRGSEWHPFPTIVASGPRTALPHAGTSEREIRAGDLLLLDFGARVDGYCADITRTVVVGRRADDRQGAMYDLVREAQQAALGGLRGEMTGKDADALARSVIERRGFGDAFGHSLGHGLGLEVHEAPRVSRANEEALPAGAVVTVEPGVYFPGWGGIRLEDDVLLTEHGAELLSDGKTELLELT